MPFQSGTADSAVDLLIQLNTFITSNGWTNLRGNTDTNVASPKAARYWRLAYQETFSVGEDFREAELIELRGTVGGVNLATVPANWYAKSANTNGEAGNVVSGTSIAQSIDEDDKFWWIAYDFGTPTTVREVMLMANNRFRAPRDLIIQWSQDNLSWTNMYQETGMSWVDNETKVFTFNDGFLFPEHASATAERAQDFITDDIQGTGVHQNNRVFVWQGPGYDANRRVYVSAGANYDLASDTQWVLLGGTTEWDTAEIVPTGSSTLGGDTAATPRLVMGLGTVNYWFYVNDLRIIVVVRSGLDDYTSAYLGFMKAFALPEDYPFPLYIGATMNGYSALNAVNSALFSSIHDAGSGGAHRWRRWDGTWLSVENREGSVIPTVYEFDPGSYLWPMHPGSVADAQFPFSPAGDNDSGGPHWADRVFPTAQNDLPIFPVLVANDPYGFVGALDGVFVAPRGGVLSAEQVVDIGGVDYRVFTNRALTQGSAYFAVRED